MVPRRVKDFIEISEHTGLDSLIRFLETVRELPLDAQRVRAAALQAGGHATLFLASAALLLLVGMWVTYDQFGLYRSNSSHKQDAVAKPPSKWAVTT